MMPNARALLISCIRTFAHFPFYWHELLRTSFHSNSFGKFILRPTHLFHKPKSDWTLYMCQHSILYYSQAYTLCVHHPFISLGFVHYVCASTERLYTMKLDASRVFASFCVSFRQKNTRTKKQELITMELESCEHIEKLKIKWQKVQWNETWDVRELHFFPAMRSTNTHIHKIQNHWIPPRMLYDRSIRVTKIYKNMARSFN